MAGKDPNIFYQFLSIGQMPAGILESAWLQEHSVWVERKTVGEVCSKTFGARIQKGKDDLHFV